MAITVGIVINHRWWLAGRGPAAGACAAWLVGKVPAPASPTQGTAGSCVGLATVVA
jgi:hypothetical protein